MVGEIGEKSGVRWRNLPVVLSLDPRHIVEGIDGGVRVRFMMAVVDG
jgi:hypothetical protein